MDAYLEFLKVFFLPCLIGGIILAFGLNLLWFIGERVKKFKKLNDLTPKKVYEALVVILIIAGLIYMVASGEGSGVENSGF